MCIHIATTDIFFKINKVKKNKNAQGERGISLESIISRWTGGRGLSTKDVRELDPEHLRPLREVPRFLPTLLTRSSQFWATLLRNTKSTRNVSLTLPVSDRSDIHQLQYGFRFVY